MENEIWKDIPGYEGRYQVSNLGNVKSLSRVIYDVNGIRISSRKSKIIKCYLTNDNYKRIGLSKQNKQKHIYIHQLVAMAFLNHKPDGTQKLVVDHINNNKLDNRLENLQVITNRENSRRVQGSYTSNYKGVSWDKSKNKWVAQIQINGKRCFLGRFDNELEASQVYQNKMENLHLSQ